MGTIDIKQWLVLGEKEERFLIEDIANHGCEGGIGGLIYYWETTELPRSRSGSWSRWW